MDLNRLEYHQVLKTIESYAKTVEGKKLILSLFPFDSQEDALSSMAQIKTAKAFIEENKTPFFGAFLDVQQILKDIRIKRDQTISDFLLIHQFLKGIHQLKLKLSSPLEFYDTAPLTPYIEALVDLKSLRTTFDDMFDEEDLKQDATPTLKTLNHQKKTLEQRLQEKLKSLVERHSEHLSEAFFTERFNRYVVPVKLSYKNRFKGTVVDYSSSGETVYMEPFDIAEMTAKIRQLGQEIDTEIKIIITSLSQKLTLEYERLITNYHTAILLDIIFAKAHYAIKINATDLSFNESLNLIEARHPFIPLEDVVENTITLLDHKKMMIISGSNTGGKTVVLKTVGLISLMALSGLLVPVSKGSSMPFYQSVFADIGDEQSIEQSLSTFSSHMTHIIDILKNIKPKGLILLDEIGGGTDPKAGASLARALLDYLSDKDVHVFVTTHYSELKAYAYLHEDVLNASVAFNKETLKPTYHLYSDTPGESHAFLIAERLGLQEAILNHARGYLKNEQDPLSDLVMQLETTKNQLEEEKEALKKVKIETDKALEKAQNEYLTYHEKKQALIDDFKKKLALEKLALEKNFNDTIEKLKASESIKTHEINEARRSLFNETKASIKKTSTHVYQPGDKVLVEKYNRPGELVKKVGTKTWLVQMGTLETRLEEASFTFLKELPSLIKQKEIAPQRFKKHVSPECDLRGLRVLEAKETLEKYLDDCLLAKLPFARIIHGFGTLAVRNMVKENLKTNPLISSFRDGGSSEGGQGVTVVYF